MESDDLIKRGREIVEELAEILGQLSDSEATEFLGGGALDTLLKALFDPSEKSNYPNLNDFLLANKERATLVALLRYAITHNYSFKGVNEAGVKCFVSPSHVQWFDDGIMFLQGHKPFEGFIGLYRKDGTLSYAVAARDARSGEPMGPDHFEFIDERVFRERLNQLSPMEISRLDEPVQQLEALLQAQDNDEAKYQELLIQYPWVLGAEYRTVQRHPRLDDRNIPDFTGVRVRDGCRDVIEIKPPFTKMFRESGKLSSDFNDAWNQAERYLDFARAEKDYLSRKGLRFDNPRCYLILGFDLPEDVIGQIRTKERMNPAIRLLTYNDLLVFMKATIGFVRNLKSDDSQVEAVEKSS